MSPAAQLEALYDAHAAGVFHYLLSIVRQESDAKDLLQEVFVKLAAKPLVADLRDPHAFLLRMAHNMAIDSLRRRGTRQAAENASQSESPRCFEAPCDPDAKAFTQSVQMALGQLPVEQRTVAWLKLWEGLTFEQIAAAQDIPLNTAASRYRYAIDKLRALLRPLYEDIKP